MRKRNLGWLCGITLLVLALSLSVLGAFLKHEPSFYRQCQTPASATSRELALTFVSHFGAMLYDRNRETWGCNTTEAELNCFFNELFDDRGEAEDLRKVGISSLCVSLDEAPKDDDGNPLPGGHARLAFRYGSGWFSTIISYDLKIWLVPKESNVIAIEIERARAGALPISKQSILNQLADFARKQNYKVTIYRHEGNSVALLDLKGDQQQAKSILTTLKIGPSSLQIRGRTLEHAVQPPEPKDLKIAPRP